jgi:hypothetical protein
VSPSLGAEGEESLGSLRVAILCPGAGSDTGNGVIGWLPSSQAGSSWIATGDRATVSAELTQLIKDFPQDIEPKVQMGIWQAA